MAHGGVQQPWGGSDTRREVCDTLLEVLITDAAFQGRGGQRRAQPFSLATPNDFSRIQLHCRAAS